MFVKKKDDDKSKKNKMLEWDNIIVALVYIILGVFMMVHPITFYKGFTTALMIILIGMGISKIASYFIIKKNTEIGTTMKLISGICLIVFGILVKVLLGSLVAMIIGLFLVYGGISKLVLGLSIKNVDKTQGKILIIAGVINMIIGIIAVLLKTEQEYQKRIRKKSLIPILKSLRKNLKRMIMRKKMSIW